MKIVLSDSAARDAITLCEQLLRLIFAGRKFQLFAPDIQGRLKRYLAVLSVSGLDFNRSYRTNDALTGNWEPTRDTETIIMDLFCEGAAELGLWKHFQMIEQNKALILSKPMREMDANRQLRLQFEDPRTFTRHEALMRKWQILGEPLFDDALHRRMTDALGVEWRDGLSFNTYWIDRILESEAFARMQEPNGIQGYAAKLRLSNDMVSVLRQVGIDWRLDLWSFEDMRADQHYFDIGLTNLGILALYSGRGMQRHFNVLSWPDRTHLHRLDYPERPSR